MSNAFVRWTVRILVAAALLAGTVALGAGTAPADPPPRTGNGTSWIGGDLR